MLRYMAILPVLALLVPVTAAFGDEMSGSHTDETGMIIQCMDGSEMVLKKTTEEPACVKPDTKAVLLERGWAIEVPAEMMAELEAMMEEKMRMMEEEEKMHEMTEQAGENMTGTVNGNMTDGMSDGMTGAVDDGNMTGMEDINMTDGMTTTNENMTVFTDEEKTAWVVNNTITVSYDRDAAPFEFINTEGELDGLAGEYMSAIMNVTGAEFELADSIETWSDALDAVRNRQADVMFIVIETENRTEYMGFTEPHTEYTWDIITVGNRNITTDNMAEYNVTTIRDYAVESWLDENMPDVNYTSVDSHEEALTSLKDGDTDVFVDSWVTATYHADESGMEDLYNSGTLETQHLRIGYRSDLPILGAILQDALDRIPDGTITIADRT